MRMRVFLVAGLMVPLLCGVLPLSQAQQSNDTMQAIVVMGGEPRLQTVARPAPAAGEVLVRVRAAGVNPADWKRAHRAPDSGVTPGWDIAGEIVAIGAGVNNWRVGDAVMGFFEATGGYAQYAVISVDAIAAKPDSLSFEQAAGIPLVAVTAYKALIDVAELKSGQRVLIQGGAGGVGSAAVQIAAARGASVITTASARNHEFLRGIGAQETIDYNTERFEDRVHDADVAMNTVDAETAIRSLATLRPGGIMVTVAGAVPEERCAAAGVRCGSPDRKTGTPIAVILAEVGQLADAGKFRVNIDAEFPLAEAAKAWTLNEKGHTRGKIILTMPL